MAAPRPLDAPRQEVPRMRFLKRVKYFFEFIIRLFVVTKRLIKER